MVQGLGADVAGAYARSGHTRPRPRAMVFRHRPGAFCRVAGFVAASPAAFGDVLLRGDKDADDGLTQPRPFCAFDCRHRQHYLRLPVLPAAWLANTGEEPAARLLEDRRAYAGLLGDDVLRRVAGGAAVVAAALPLGKDATQTKTGHAAGRIVVGEALTAYASRSDAPSPMIFLSSLPTTSRSRPS